MMMVVTVMAVDLHLFQRYRQTPGGVNRVFPVFPVFAVCMASRIAAPRELFCFLRRRTGLLHGIE
jgi:hypothetical protein